MTWRDSERHHASTKHQSLTIQLGLNKPIVNEKERFTQLIISNLKTILYSTNIRLLSILDYNDEGRNNGCLVSYRKQSHIKVILYDYKFSNQIFS